MDTKVIKFDKKNASYLFSSNLPAVLEENSLSSGWKSFTIANYEGSYIY